MGWTSLEQGLKRCERGQTEDKQWMKCILFGPWQSLCTVAT